MVEEILATNDTVDVKRDNAELQLFSFSQPIKSRDFDDVANEDRGFKEEIGPDGRVRRKVLFNTTSDNGNFMNSLCFFLQS